MTLPIGFKFSFTIPEAPIPLKRARITRSGRVYDPNKALKGQTLLKILKVVPERLKLNGPVEVEFEFGMQIPKSASKKKKIANAGKYHSIKPDIDNLVKYYLDVMQDRLFEDDSKVVSLKARKIQHITPYVKVSIKKVEDLPPLES